MKLTYNLLLILCAIFFMASCQEEKDALGTGGTGYLRLTVNGSNETTTKAATLPEGYTGEQLAVEIVDAEGKTVKNTNDWTEWEGDQIALSAGKYTIKAHSYGFDGKQSAMAAPYYYGSAEVSIENGKEANATVVCKLANVKMSVKIADDIKENFQKFGVSVEAKDGTSCDPLAFNIDLAANGVADTAYFPVTDLVVTYSATNKAGDKQNSDKYELAKVAGNDHYILNFTLQEQGAGGVTVEVDETMHAYIYEFKVSPNPTDGATLEANAWAKFAYLSASNVTASSGATLSNLKLQYRQEGTEAWADLETTTTGEAGKEVYTATATSLAANTTYEYRLAGDNEFATTPQQFTTEEATFLTNGDFEDWCVRSAATALGSSNTTFPCSESDYDAGKMFWDTSNRGANSASQIDPTNFVTDPVVSGTRAACLKTASVMGFLAAASLYTGQFVSATMDWGSFSAVALIDFGRPFTSRPIALKGSYKYTPAKVTVGGDLPANATVSEGSDDQCSIYIALTKGAHRVDNSNPDTFLSLERIKQDDNIIAYGELPSGAATSGEGYVNFTIPLKYKNLTDTPTHIIVVCSASKYGDYMTGGEGSTLYVDDFSLIYDGTPTIWDLSNK